MPNRRHFQPVRFLSLARDDALVRVERAVYFRSKQREMPLKSLDDGTANVLSRVLLLELNLSTSNARREWRRRGGHERDEDLAVAARSLIQPQ